MLAESGFRGKHPLHGPRRTFGDVDALEQVRQQPRSGPEVAVDRLTRKAGLRGDRVHAHLAWRIALQQRARGQENGLPR